MAEQSYQAGDGDGGARMDKWLSEQSDTLSRTRAKALVEGGHVRGGGQVITDPRAKVVAGEVYIIDEPEVAAAEPVAEDIPMEILFEDSDLIVVNKPAGMVVHPAAGSWTGTLVNALLYHCGDSLSGIGGVARPGIVHRIDKDTSGVLVVAKSDAAHQGLTKAFAAHDIERAYVAFTRCAPKPASGRIETRIARSNTDRKKMAVVRESQLSPSALWHDPNAGDFQEKGKVAITNYEMVTGYGRLDERSVSPAAAKVECRLETGRTHQIRVHLAHIGAPLIGDGVYGRHRGIKAWGKGDAFDEATQTARALLRQALHAKVLGFAHPVTGEALRFEADLPDDLAALERALAAMPRTGR